jgi:tetratricopeptide (TPR) repeat protein
MTYSEIQKYHKDILEAVLGKRLRDAMSIISKIIVLVTSSDLHNRYQSVSDTYRNMLKYSFELAPDPERAKIYNQLQQSLLELSDDIRESWIRSMDLFGRKQVMIKYDQFESQYASQPDQVTIRLSQDILKTLQQDTELSPDQENETFENLVFYYLWLKERYTEETRGFLKQVMDCDEIDASKKSLMMSAITMSMLRQFDRGKLFLLFDYSVNDDTEIRQRAMIGLFLSILMYNRRFSLYKDILERIKSIPDIVIFQERMLAVLIQFLRASETEKITRKIQEEIVPEVMKMRSQIEDKLNLEELLSKENFEEKNPEWEDFFKDAPDVYQKLEQFSKMQVEGADVFMGAFALLKHFAFFREMANWFLPFRAANPSVNRAFSSLRELDIPLFLGGLEQSTVLCNSDKYSFCLNLQNMPDQQQKTMLELFNMELKAMNEMMEDEFKINPETKNKIVNTQYFQDLYRFFKLHPSRKEYESLFEYKVDVINNEVFRIIYDNPKLVGNLAEYYFAKDHYPEAAILFNWLNNKKQSFELLEKLGFCYQKMGNFKLAIERYKQAELFDRNKIWLQKKLGYCYRKTGDFHEAIEYYKEIIDHEPKDMNNLAYLGQLYINIEDYEEALQYYYKVEYENPSNSKVFRPIGWCSFVLGKYENAIKYFEKILLVKPNKSDYLNVAHCYWVTGNLPHALEAYREALRLSAGNIQWFREAFIQDGRYLKDSGMDDLDISLMMDYVLLDQSTGE